MGAAAPLRVVGIGASAGGLEALREMLAPVRQPTGLAFVVVQHLDPNHESLLAQLLASHTSLRVVQAEGGEWIVPETVYIIPPGFGLAIEGGVLALTEFAQPRGLRRPIDDFFLSLAADRQAAAACVILSGTGADGTIGLRAIKENGGVCAVQDPATARYDGMPVSAAGTGLVDFVLPPDQIVGCLMTFFSRAAARAGADEAHPAGVAESLEEIGRILRRGVGHDFSGYKRGTLVRRVERRMQVRGIARAADYAARLASDPAEQRALFSDLLINVTRFFRDPEHFDALRTRVVEPLVKERAGGGDIRVWVPGCSSGEEAYSIAMLFADAATRHGSDAAVQVFATDIDDQMLQIARAGTYSLAALADVPLGLREQFLVPHAECFAMAAPLREMVRFSRHSLIKDPPFSRLDLISCRNLMIYFDDELQRTVLPLMAYALQPGGTLFLGPSESVGRCDHLFSPIDQQFRLFARAPGRPAYPAVLPASGPPTRRLAEPGLMPSRPDSAGMGDTPAVTRLLDAYSPPALVLDPEERIVAAYGRLGRYFDFPVSRVGGASVIALARPGLRNALGRVLREARGMRRRTIARGVAAQLDRGRQMLDVIVDPLRDGTLLVVLREAGPFQPGPDDELAEVLAGDDPLGELEEELLATRHRLRAATEELETANEELKSSNEEMMSMNEELQSTNEELITVNDELKGKVDELTLAHADLRNFFDSTHLASLVVDAHLRLRSYTEAARTLFPLQPGDIGRPLGEVASLLTTTDYLTDAKAVAAGGEPTRRRVFTRGTGRTHVLRAEPYRSAGGTVEGATLVFADITDELALERELAEERERFELAIRAGRIGVWEYRFGEAAFAIDTMGRDLFRIVQPGAVPLREVLAGIAAGDRATVLAEIERARAEQRDFEASFQLARAGPPRWLKTYGKLVSAGGAQRFIGVAIDVTVERLAAQTKELMLREMNHRVKNLFAVIGGMISAGARAHPGVGGFAAEMRERIAALGRAHSLALPTEERPQTSLGSLLDSVLSPYRDLARIELEGPEVYLHYPYVSPVALVFHEWASNAVKYGALGAADGVLEVRWQHTAEGVRLRWIERSARSAAAEDRAGFGTQLVSASLRQIAARLTRSAAPGAFTLELAVPGQVFAGD
ncbi:MAG: PAS domain-containing protein [Sphingomonadales bacterium]|nr:PAS domain-containing protein [Sphingomonadales bacterium]